MMIHYLQKNSYAGRSKSNCNATQTHTRAVLYSTCCSTTYITYIYMYTRTHDLTWGTDVIGLMFTCTITIAMFFPSRACCVKSVHDIHTQKTHIGFGNTRCNFSRTHFPYDAQTTYTTCIIRRSNSSNFTCSFQVFRRRCIRMFFAYTYTYIGRGELQKPPAAIDAETTLRTLSAFETRTIRFVSRSSETHLLCASLYWAVRTRPLCR